MTALLNNYLAVYTRCKRLRKTIRKQLGLTKLEIRELISHQIRCAGQPDHQLHIPQFTGVPNDPQLGD